MSVTTAVVARGRHPAPSITALPSGPRGQDPRHRRHRLPGHARRPRARRARRPAAVAGCAARAEARPPRRASSSSAPAGTSPTGGRCAGRWRASTASSISRARRRCGPGTASASSTLNVRGTRIVLEEALRRGREAGRPHLLGRRDRARPSPRHRGREPAVHGRPSGDRLRQLQARGRGRGAAAGRARAAGGDRQPHLRARPRRPDRGPRCGLVRRFLLARSRPTSTAALNIVDVRDVAQGHLLADAKGEAGERYILGGRNFTLDRLFADFARISGRAGAAGEAPGSARPCSPWRPWRGPGCRCRSRRTRCARRSQWWTYRNTKAKKRAGLRAAAPRGDARGRGATGRWSSSATACRTPRGGRRRRPLAPVDSALLRVGGRVLGG